MVTCKTNFSFSSELNAIINDGNMSLDIISILLELTIFQVYIRFY